MSDAGWIHPGPISPLDCDQADCDWRVHGVPDQYHANALARHTAEAHQAVGAVSTRDDILAGLRQLDDSQPGDMTPEELLDAYRAEVIAERDAQIIAWLCKKAGEYGVSNRENRAKAEAVGRMADKLSRGAVR